MNENLEVDAIPCHSSQTVNFFDRIIGFIEDIVISTEFQVNSNYLEYFYIQLLSSKASYLPQQKQSEFLEKNYELFTDDEENRICYMDIFNEYTAIIENFIMDHLKESVCDAELNRFLTELRRVRCSGVEKTGNLSYEIYIC